MNDKAEVDRYYRDIGLADSLRKEGRTREALQAALANLARVPSVVSEAIREYGRFDLRSIPPVEVGTNLAAVLGDASALREIRAVVESKPELAAWRAVVTQAEQDLESVRAIRQLVIQEPGVIQSVTDRVKAATRDQVKTGHPRSVVIMSLAGLGGQAAG